MAKFKSGQFVQARNGRGSVYMINSVFTRDGIEYYDFDNGSVDVRKRARSGWHRTEVADKGYRVVT